MMPENEVERCIRAGVNAGSGYRAGSMHRQRYVMALWLCHPVEQRMQGVALAVAMPTRCAASRAGGEEPVRPGPEGAWPCQERDKRAGDEAVSAPLALKETEVAPASAMAMRAGVRRGGAGVGRPRVTAAQAMQHPVRRQGRTLQSQFPMGGQPIRLMHGKFDLADGWFSRFRVAGQRRMAFAA